MTSPWSPSIGAPHPGFPKGSNLDISSSFQWSQCCRCSLSVSCFFCLNKICCLKSSANRLCCSRFSICTFRGVLLLPMWAPAIWKLDTLRGVGLQYRALSGLIILEEDSKALDQNGDPILGEMSFLENRRLTGSFTCILMNIVLWRRDELRFGIIPKHS